MKFILCKHCGDIVKLHSVARTCLCGRSSGWYVDDVNAVIGGDAIPLGISNTSLERAVRLRPANGRGESVDMWVMAIESANVRRNES